MFLLSVVLGRLYVFLLLLGSCLVHSLSTTRATRVLRTRKSSRLRAVAYRNLQEKDIPSVAELCSAVFDGGEGWRVADENFDKAESIQGHMEVMIQRYRELVLKEESIIPQNKRKQGNPHVMIVAVDNENEGIDKVCGFLEVGFLPSPIPVSVTWAGATVQQVTDVPYLGNVLVHKEYRRRGIGTRLVRIGEKVCQKWKEGMLWLAVDSDNFVAIEMYKSMGFESRVDERTFRSPPLAVSDTPKQPLEVKVPRIYMSKSTL